MSLRFSLVLVGLSLMMCPFAKAQDGAGKGTEGIREDWLKKDIANAERIRPVFPLKDYDYKKFKDSLKPEGEGDSIDLGFGVKLESPYVTGGYTAWRLKVLVHEGRILQFEMQLSASGAGQGAARSAIAKIWGNETFQEEARDEKGLAAWQERINAALGSGPGAEVPASLKAALDELRSPLKDLTYRTAEGGMARGGRGGLIPTQGDSGLVAIKEAKRYDLLQDLLRSKNPISRIYAAEALLTARGEGRALTAADRKAISAIREMEQVYTRVEGCEASYFKAKDILVDPKDEVDWKD